MKAGAIVHGLEKLQFVGSLKLAILVFQKQKTQNQPMIKDIYWGHDY